MSTAEETPYLEHQQWRADELGEAKARATNWRYTALLALGGMVLFGIGNIYQSTLPRYKPYYVEIDTCSGRARVVGRAPEQVTLRAESLKDQARQFVEQLRRVSSDKVLMGADWSETGLYAHVTARGRQLLNQQVTTQNPLLVREMVMIDVQRILPVSPRSLDMRWVETRYSPAGERLDTHTWSGIFTWTQQEPKTEEELSRNPLGVFFDQWSMSREAY